MKYFSYNPLPSLWNNSISNVKVWLFTGMWILLSTGCETDSHVPEWIGAEMVLNLRLDTSGMLTRSSDGSGSEDSSLTENESKIDWEDVWIAVFEAESGERIEIVYSKDISGVDTEGNKLRLPIDISGYSGDICIMVLANCSRYGIIASDLDEIYTVQDLKDLTFAFLPDNLKDKDSDVEYFPLPMFGSKTVTAGFPLDKEVDINMTRGLAKIEIVDNLEDGINIDSAILCNYARSGSVISGDQDAVIGTDLVFNRKEEGGKSTFYVYVPEISLGEAESEIRRIRLNLSNGNESEIRLINYTGNQPADSPSSEWDRLRRNYIYRFNVTGLIPSEPEIEIQPTIVICWYQTNNGKFNDYNNRVNFASIENLDMPYISAVINGTASGYLPGGYTGYIGMSYEFKLPEHEGSNNDFYNKLAYLIVDYNNYPLEGEYYLLHRLAPDVAVKYNIEDITYCWLNTLPLKWKEPSLKYFPTGYRYRIYWSGPKDKKYDLSILDSNYDNITPDNMSYDEYRRYWYVDININSLNISRLNIMVEPNDMETDVTIYDIFIENINGEEYYVFYAN